jgi:sugar O-acyltransferase (sialic acid O-acetyltransferase NeuD family)
MKKIVIVGAGGFGREVLEIFKDQNKTENQWDILGFLDEKEDMWGKIINNYPVLGGLDWFDNKKDVGCVIAIGNPKTRKRIAQLLVGYHVRYFNAIHPSVIISDFIGLGTDVIICAGSIVSVNSSIKDHVIINLKCTIGHDAVLENYCSIMPGVSISGEDHLGEGVYVGTGATIIQQITVGHWSIIGAGATVLSDVPEKVTAFGLPAKIMKNSEI